MLNIGVLALQGGVAEHIDALRQASAKTKIPISLRTVRTAKELEGLHGLVLPGGESTTLSLLLQKEGMLEPIRQLPALFGTCAGLILMAQEIEGAETDQKFLHVLPIDISRNAYGSQLDSFENVLEGELTSKTKILFIRAPKIREVQEGVEIIARLPNSHEPVIVAYRPPGKFLLGATCHPEMTTSKVHEFFLKEMTATLGQNK
jgi:5'-phosphate synthase pdxT subunit